MRYTQAIYTSTADDDVEVPMQTMVKVPDTDKIEVVQAEVRMWREEYEDVYSPHEGMERINTSTGAAEDEGVGDIARGHLEAVSNPSTDPLDNDDEEDDDTQEQRPVDLAGASEDSHAMYRANEHEDAFAGISARGNVQVKPVPVSDI